MCLGIPGRVVEHLPMPTGELSSGLVEFDGLRRKVCLELVPEVAVGDYVIVHAGIAISRVDADEAARLLEHLQSMGESEPLPEAAP
jgi:hydrogenase expression/formation protein HypC